MPKIPRTQVSVGSDMAMMRPLQGDGWGAPGRATQQLGASIAKLGQGISSMFEGMDAENEKALEQADALFLAREKNQLDLDELKHRETYSEDPTGYEARRKAEVYDPYIARIQGGVKSKRYRERLPLYVEGETGRLMESATRFGAGKRQEKLFEDTQSGITNGKGSGEVNKLDPIIAQAGKKSPDEIGAEFDAALPSVIAGVNAMIDKYPGTRAQRDQLLGYARAQIEARIDAVNGDGQGYVRKKKFLEEWQSIENTVRAMPQDRRSQLPLSPKQQQRLAGVNPQVVTGLEALQGLVGRELPVNSGYRDEKANERAGGANNSQHLHRNAVDIDVSGMSPEERINLIRHASSLGFRGIGVYPNAIHLDVGPKRSWGPNFRSNSVPNWARGVINEHLEGKIARAAVNLPQNPMIDTATDRGPIQVDATGRINPASMYARAAYKVAQSPLVGQVPSWGPSVGITKGTAEEWARFFTMVTQAESSHRVGQRNPDGSVARFPSTPAGERSFGPGQFNVGEYGLKTWDDVNNPDRVIDAYIEVAKKGKFEAYFGAKTWQRIRNGQLPQWFASQVEPEALKIAAAPQQTAAAAPAGESAPPIKQRGIAQVAGSPPIMVGFKGKDGAFDQAAFEAHARSLGYEPRVVSSWQPEAAMKEAAQLVGNGRYAVYGFSLGAQTARDFEASMKKDPDRIITVGAYKDARLEFRSKNVEHYFDRSGVGNPAKGELVDAPHTGPGNVQQRVAERAAGKLPGKPMGLGAPGSANDNAAGKGSVGGSVGPSLPGSRAAAGDEPAGLPKPVVPGNIDLSKRPVLKNDDGSVSTIETITVSFEPKDKDGKLGKPEFVVIPTIIDGKRVSEEQAVQHYIKTDQHLGKFASQEDADTYAKGLSAQQGQRVAGTQVAQAGGPPPMQRRTLEDELAESMAPKLHQQRMQDAAVIEKQIKSFESMALEGKDPDPKIIEGIRKKIRGIEMPELENRLNAQLETAKLIREFQKAPPIQLTRMIGEIQATIAANKGVSSPLLEQRLDALQKLRTKQAETLQRNPFEWARVNGFPEQLPMSPRDMTPENLGTRKTNAELVANQYGIKPTYFPFKEEKDAMTEILARGGPDAAVILGNMREAFGEDMKLALREIAPKAPEAARAGFLMAYGGDREIVKDILAGVARRMDPNFVDTVQPEQKNVVDRVLEKDLGEVFGKSPSAVREADAVKRAVRAALLGRYPWRKEDDMKESEVREIVQGVMGRRSVDNRPYGGVVNQTYKGDGWIFNDDNRVVLHNSINHDLWKDAFRQINAQALQEAGLEVPINGRTGQPLNDLGELIANGDARLRQLGYGRYAVQMRDGPVWADVGVPDENGIPYKQFELDFKKLSPLLSAKRPDLFNVGY